MEKVMMVLVVVAVTSIDYFSVVSILESLQYYSIQDLKLLDSSRLKKTKEFSPFSATPPIANPTLRCGLESDSTTS